MEVRVMIGGEAGQGIQTIANIMSKFFLRLGYYVFTEQSYQSRIRGGHNFTQIRVSSKPVYSIDDGVDILIALNEETIHLHKNELSDKGVIIYDNELIKSIDITDRFLGVPLQKTAVEKTQSRVAINSVACGVLVGLLDSDLNLLESLMREQFKDPEVGEKNIQAVRAGYEFGKSRRDFPFKVPFLEDNARLLIDGGSAVGFGAIVAGCRFLSAYPMTPGTAVMNFLAEHEIDFDIVVEQAEDEIAAINMAVGGFFAGARSMVTTSGGGFALMVEGLSLAGMTETPVVIHVAQRPGPATGLPTRTEQADLNFVIHAGHGEFPKYVTAPRDQKDAYYKTIKAFEIAEKYQVPSIILTDQYLIDSKAVIDGLHVPGIKNYRILGDKNYLRHKITEDGISPLAIPGEFEGFVITDSDEHDEEGHITEDLNIRKKMVEKRLRKKLAIMRDVEEPVYFGVDKSKVVFIGWGSTYGVIREAISNLLKEGYEIGHLHFSDVYPLPTKILNDFKDKKLYTIEGNYEGQLAALIRKELCIKVDRGIVKYNGMPFFVEEIMEGVREIMG